MNGCVVSGLRSTVQYYNGDERANGIQVTGFTPPLGGVARTRHTADEELSVGRVRR
jgi:hypothetical protein